MAITFLLPFVVLLIICLPKLFVQDKEVALNRTVDIFCRLVKKQNDVVDLVNMYIPFPFIEYLNIKFFGSFCFLVKIIRVGIAQELQNKREMSKLCNCLKRLDS